MITTSAVQAAVSTVAVPKNATKAADAVTTTSAEQADERVDSEELARMRKERLKILYEWSQVKHWDTVTEVDARTLREVTANLADSGVEDPVQWEEYYRTNCKLRRRPV